MLFLYFTLAAMDTGSGIVRGLNRPIMSTVITLMGSCILRIVWIATAVRANQTLEMVYLSYPISWGVTGLCHLCVSVYVTRKMKRLYQPEEL